MRGRNVYAAGWGKWMFDLLKLRYQKSPRVDLIGHKNHISSLVKIAPTELGGCCRKPGCLRRRILEKNDVLMGGNQGLKDIDLTKAFRASDVVRNYSFNGEATRRAAPVDFVIHLELGLGDKNLREIPPIVYEIK